MVEAPGVCGDFGVLPGHMAFISALRPGVVTIHGEKMPVRVFVASGVAEVNADSCVILAEHVVDLSAVTHADAEVRLAQAKTALDNAFDDASRVDAARELAVAEAIVNLV